MKNPHVFSGVGDPIETVDTSVAGGGDGAAVFAQLDRILRSPGFASSPQLSRLLQFLLKETLAGRGDSLMQ